MPVIGLAMFALGRQHAGQADPVISTLADPRPIEDALVAHLFNAALGKTEQLRGAPCGNPLSRLVVNDRFSRANHVGSVCLGDG